MQTDNCGACGWTKPAGSSCGNPSCMYSPAYSPPKRQNSNARSECFTQCTPILTPEGWKAIADLQIGDPVVSLDSSGAAGVETITAIPMKTSGLIHEVSYHNGRLPIRVSWCHPFMTSRGWKMTFQLQPGDRLHAFGKGSERETHRIDEIRQTHEREDLLNLHTTGPHNFVVEGAIVHNYSYLRTLRGLVADAHLAFAGLRDMYPKRNQVGIAF